MKKLLIILLACKAALHCQEPCYIVPKGTCEDGKCEFVCRISYDYINGSVHLYSYEDGHWYQVYGDCWLDHADDRCLCFLEDM